MQLFDHPACKHRHCRGRKRKGHNLNMGEEPRSATCHSSRFSFSAGVVAAGTSNTFASSNDITLDHNAFFQNNLAGAISMARGDRGSRHSCFSENSMATTGSRRSAQLSVTPFSNDVQHSEESDGDGVSSLLCTCLTANYISVGYLLVPWGTFEIVKDSCTMM